MNIASTQLPAWTSVAFTALGMMLMALYQHLLARRAKRQDHRLEIEATTYEKQLAFIQERHTKRLDALDHLNAELMEFDHAVMHVARGNTGYIAAIHDYSAKARNRARSAELLLGHEAYDAVLAWTDAGRAILDASFCVTDRTVAVARAHGLPPQRLAQLENIVGTAHSIREGGASLTADYDEELRSTYRQIILGACKFTDEFSESAYDKAVNRFNKIRDDITRTLPTPPR